MEEKCGDENYRLIKRSKINKLLRVIHRSNRMSSEAFLLLILAKYQSQVFVLKMFKSCTWHSNLVQRYLVDNYRLDVIAICLERHFIRLLILVHPSDHFRSSCICQSLKGICTLWRKYEEGIVSIHDISIWLDVKHLLTVSKSFLLAKEKQEFRRGKVKTVEIEKYVICI